MDTRIITATANTTPIRVLAGGLMLMPAVLLGIFGYAHFRDGIANDSAIPVPVSMVAHLSLPKSAYADAAVALANADPRNGDAAIIRTEAGMRTEAGPEQLADALEDGLSHAPASARGWLLLCDARYSSDKPGAARALSQSILLAPREFWLIGLQVLDAARLWSDLDKDTQTRVLVEMRLMWAEPVLRAHLLTVLRSPQAAALATRAFSQDDIRAINRWASREQSRKRAS